MPAGNVGTAKIEVIGDVSRFARDVQNDLNRILAGIRLDKVEPRADFDRIEREARDAAGDASRVIEGSGEEMEDAFREVGREAERQFDRVEREARDAGRGIGRALRGAAVGLGAAFAAVQIGQFLRSSVQAADDLSDAIGISEQIIEQTGGAARLTADEVRELSRSLSLEIGVDSAQVQSAANVLLTFRNVSEDSFGRALGLAADLSTVLGTDLNGATLQLGKALNDPVRGISALARAGVQFTEQQKEQIQALVESGDLLGAQNIILQELESQVGGTAATAADSWAIVTNAFRESQRALGEALIPALDDLAPALIEIADALGPVLGQIGSTLADALTALAPSLEVLGGALADALGQIDLAPVGEAIGAVVEALAPLLPVLGQLIATLLPPFAEIIEQLAEPLSVVAQILAEHITQALALLEPHLPAIVDLFGQMATVLAENLEQTLPIVSQLILDLLEAVLPLLPQIIELAESLLPLAENSEAWIPILQFISDLLLVAVIPAIEQLSALLSGDFADAFPQVTSQLEILKAVVSNVFSFVSGFISGAVERVRSTINTLSAIPGRVRSFFNDMRLAIMDRANAAVDFVRGIPGRITGAIGDLGNLLADKGRQLIQGFIDGIRNAFDEVRSTLGELTNMLPDWKGPAERDRALLRESGQFIMQGFQAGIQDERENLRRLLSDVTTEIGAPSATEFSGRVAGGDGATVDQAAGGIEVRVFIGDQELKGMIRTEVSERNRDTRRRVGAGTGGAR